MRRQPQKTRARFTMGFLGKIAERVVSASIDSAVFSQRRVAVALARLINSKLPIGLNITHGELFDIAVEIDHTRNDYSLHRLPDHITPGGEFLQLF